MPPETIVASISWPALGAGILIVLWGLLVLLILAIAGLVVFVVSAGIWTRELDHGGIDDVE